MAGDKRYRPNVDYTVSTQTSIDGHAAFTPDVNVAGTVTIDTTGLSTSAKQDTGNTSLSAISGKLPATLGPKSAATSLSTTPAGLLYETVAASATDQILGGAGAIGDYLSHIVIQPATTGAGTCTIKDSSTVIYTFTSGTLADLSPITVPFGAFSTAGAWKVTTGGSVAIVAFGVFT
ncbi:MAG: hypothetical protein ACEQSH_00995 [Bacteroidia bacterium]